MDMSFEEDLLVKQEVLSITDLQVSKNETTGGYYRWGGTPQ